MPVSKLSKDFDVDVWLNDDLSRYTDKNWQGYDEVTGDKNTSEADRAKAIRSIVEDSEKNHACSSCPYEKVCTRFLHDKRDAFTKVKGCSYHPDQKKYEGHSTTITITDTTKSDRKQITWDAWATNYAAANATSATSAGVLNGVDYRNTDGKYVIYRACLVHDTSAIPASATVSAAKYIIYHVTRATVSRTAQIQQGNATDPQGAADLSDYDRTIFDTVGVTLCTWPYASNAFPENQYVNVPLSTLSGIKVNAVSRNGIRTTEDITNTPVGGGSSYSGYYNLQGYSAANPPKLEITYSVNYWKYIDGTATWNAWNEGWAVGAGR